MDLYATKDLYVVGRDTPGLGNYFVTIEGDDSEWRVRAKNKAEVLRWAKENGHKIVSIRIGRRESA
jgi:hypothetical protein